MGGKSEEVKKIPQWILKKKMSNSTLIHAVWSCITLFPSANTTARLNWIDIVEYTLQHNSHSDTPLNNSTNQLIATNLQLNLQIAQLKRHNSRTFKAKHDQYLCNIFTQHNGTLNFKGYVKSNSIVSMSLRKLNPSLAYLHSSYAIRLAHTKICAQVIQLRWPNFVIGNNRSQDLLADHYDHNSSIMKFYPRIIPQMLAILSADLSNLSNWMFCFCSRASSRDVIIKGDPSINYVNTRLFALGLAERNVTCIP